MSSGKNKFLLKTNNPIILASNSAIRKQLLKGSGLKFKTKPSNVNETLLKSKMRGKPFSIISKTLALKKALSISKKFHNCFVIGADQICVFENRQLEKPLTKDKAVRQLMMLSGNDHKQISGCSICFNGKSVYTFYKTAVLNMRKLTKKQISLYVDLDKPLNSCGSYRFESKGYLLFSKVIGDNFTILGLPLFSLFSCISCQDVPLFTE